MIIIWFIIGFSALGLLLAKEKDYRGLLYIPLLIGVFGLMYLIFAPLKDNYFMKLLMVILVLAGIFFIGKQNDKRNAEDWKKSKPFSKVDDVSVYNVTDTTITLQFHMVARTEKYEVLKAGTEEVMGTFIPPDNSKYLTVELTNLTPDTEYEMTVRSVVGYRKCEPSDVVTARTYKEVPKIPDGWL